MFDYRIDYQLGDTSALIWQGGYGRTTQEVEENFATLGIRPVRDSDNTNAYQFIKLELTPDADNSYIVQYYLNYHDRDDVSLSKVFDPSALGVAADPFQLTLDFSLDSKRHNLEFTHHNSSLDDTRFIWGLSAQLDQISSPYFLGPGIDVDRRTRRAFFNIEHDVADTHLFHLGTLYESNEFDGDRYSPRFSYIYRASQEHSLRYTISRAIRQPFVLESDANAFFTQDLTFGGWYSGSPFLGQFGALPPGEGGLNLDGGLFFMWHSHNEKELTNFDIFPGGMLTFVVIEPPGTPIP